MNANVKAALIASSYTSGIVGLFAALVLWPETVGFSMMVIVVILMLVMVWVSVFERMGGRL